MRQLQELDRRLWALRRRLTEIPAQAASAQQARDAQAQRLAETDARVKTLQVQQKTKEGDLAGKEETIKKTQAQLFQIKTNKEYTALQHELEGFKADRSVLEDDVLLLLDHVQEAQRLVTQDKERLRQQEESLATTTAELDRQAQQVQHEVSGFEQQREQLAVHVPKELLETYERVLTNREGLALVPVANDACGGCHMALPPQVIHEARVAEKLMRCGNCARLLFWPGDAE